MKLSIDRDFHGPRGFQKFGGLLIQKLREYGVKIVRPHEKPDILLSFINAIAKKRTPRRTKQVLRLDGVYYDVRRLFHNNSIKRSIREVDGVVYQSHWAQKFVEGMLKVRPATSTVIYNGTSQSRISAAPVEETPFEKVWLCCSHWRTNKRLKSIILSFLDLPGDLGLYIAGKADYKYDHPRVKYFGHLEGEKLLSLYRSSDYFCHICHLDACPNAVVEALSAGLPVLCNNIGGTPELVRKDGVIAQLDKPFDFQPIKNMDIVGPSDVNHQTLLAGMEEMMDREWNVERPDLDIGVSAKKYYDFFAQLLS